MCCSTWYSCVYWLQNSTSRKLGNYLGPTGVYVIVNWSEVCGSSVCLLWNDAIRANLQGEASIRWSLMYHLWWCRCYCKQQLHWFLPFCNLLWISRCLVPGSSMATPPCLRTCEQKCSQMHLWWCTRAPATVHVLISLPSFTFFWPQSGGIRLGTLLLRSSYICHVWDSKLEISKETPCTYVRGNNILKIQSMSTGRRVPFFCPAELKLTYLKQSCDNLACLLVNGLWTPVTINVFQCLCNPIVLPVKERVKGS